MDISAKKTEWVYLHNPDQAEMASCAPCRKPGPCCDRIKLAGVPITHFPKFCYLGSFISESGRVSVESTIRMGKVVAALNRISKYWSSPASVRAKCRVFKSRVLPVLEYAAECVNQVQANLKSIDIFLNSCRYRILSLPKWRRGWRRQRADLVRSVLSRLHWVS